MKTQIVLIIACIFLICGTCEYFADHEYRIRVRNKSSQSITAYAEYILPDTMLSIQKPETLKTIQPGEFKDIHGYEVGDDSFERLKNERITIFILSMDVVSNYPWDTIRDKYMILKRYEIKESDLVDKGSIS